MIEIINCDQGTEEWFRARMGMPTASMFADIMSPGKGSAASKMRRTYMLKLAGEILTGEPMDNPTTAHMKRGSVMEEEVADFYALMTDAALERVGFIVNGAKGCSPDRLIGADGMLQIKTKLPHLMIDLLLRADEFPAEHKAQCQGELWVAEREWIDLAVYWPRLPPFIKRAYRDEAYIAELAAAVDQFNAELAETVERVRQLGCEPESFAPDLAAAPDDPLAIPAFLRRAQPVRS
jgi:hypothetical protein